MNIKIIFKLTRLLVFIYYFTLMYFALFTSPSVFGGELSDIFNIFIYSVLFIAYLIVCFYCNRFDDASPKLLKILIVIGYILILVTILNMTLFRAHGLW